jgi:hypothetical protein
LIEKYDTETLWFDGVWTSYYWTLEDSDDLYQFIRELKPGVFIDNRVSKRRIFKKGFGSFEQIGPDSKLKHYWKSCYTMNDSWGFKIEETDWKGPESVYKKLTREPRFKRHQIMKHWTLAFLLILDLEGLTQQALGQKKSEDWLPHFLERLDPENALANKMNSLGKQPTRAQVIATAATHFRSRSPLTSLWVIPTTAKATELDIEQADKAIDHIITDRSGEFPLPDNLPWFNAPVKLVTLARFPHFDYLARAYASTKEERYAAAMVRDMLDFVEHVPLSKSVDYHVQVAANLNPWNWVLLQWRVKRWIDVLAHLRASPSLSDEDYLRILNYMWDEVDWLVPHKILGLHNGTLGNASTILYASLQYPEARSASLWQSDSTALLDSFLDTAFYPREFLIELTLGYSEGTLLMCSTMFESLPDTPAKDRISPKLEAIFDAHVGMMKPDRSIPRYGDHGIYDIRDRVLRKGAQLFDRPDLAKIADQSGAKERSDGFQSFPFESNPYYLSGYYAMRNGWDMDAQYLSMDAGPFGTNHQHGDKLSITLSADGAAFIVDPGTSLYTSAEPGPRYDMRLGFLHNVITIDGIDPNTGWDRHYAFDVLENRWVTNPVYDFLEGTYEFRNNLLDAMWRRSVFYVKDDYWILIDAIYGEGEHRVESNLQFMVGNEVQLEDDRAQATAPNGATLDVAEAFGADLQSEVLIGDTHFPGTTFLRQYPSFLDWQPGGRGWVGSFGNHSPLNAVRTHPAPALLKSGTVKFPFKSVTVLTPSIEKQARQSQIRVVEDNPDRFTVEIANDGKQVDQFSWSLADWPDHDEKISDDSGWWVRRVEGEVSRIIVMNEDSVTIDSVQETIQLSFDGPFEGRFDRTDAGWIVTPDAYNAVTPELLTFKITRDGLIESFSPESVQPLQSNTGHNLVLQK